MSEFARLGVVIDPQGARSGVDAVNRALDTLRSHAQRTMGFMDRLGANLQKSLDITGAIFNLKNAFLGLGAGVVFQDLMNTNTEFERMKAALETVDGSQAQAAETWNRLVDLAAKTPFTLDQTVEAYLRLKAMGLDPSERAILSYGNTASAMGKSMMQMIEAVADAATLQFERLKEFGIRANQEGDSVKFTFQGITTEVAKDAQAIQEYLLNIGEATFGGGMARQMETIGGKLSNLEDAVARVKGDSAMRWGKPPLRSVPVSNA